MTPKGAETVAQFEARRRTKLQEISSFDDDTRTRFFDLMQPQVPAVPAGYFMNAARYAPTAYNVATAMHCAMAFAMGCVLPNDRVTAYSLIEGGKVVQGDDPADQYIAEFDRQFRVADMDDAF
jgi:hypothetical protein